MKIRDELKWFAEKMETELRANDHKGGWRDCWLEDLLVRIPEEYSELLEAVRSGSIETIVSEAADVANFALMVADIVHRYGVQSKERAALDADNAQAQSQVADLSVILLAVEEKLVELRDLARTGLPPDTYGLTEDQWAQHRLPVIASKLSGILDALGKVKR